MTQTARLIATLKKCLKAKGMTYRQLGNALSLSEASIKRLFSEQTFSIRRLEEICDILNFSLYDLAKLSADAETGPSTLSVDQEAALAENPKRLVFFYLLLSGRNPESICADYDVSPEESLRFLLDLDRLDLIELHPGNKVRPRTHKNIQWRKDGPIRTRYESAIIRELLDAPFDPQEHRLRFETGKLSDGSQSVMAKKIDRLIREYVEMTEIDQALPQEKSHNTGLLIAFRPWVFSLIDAFRRN